MAAINITEQAAAAAAAPDFEVYNCHENHLLHLNLGAGVNRDGGRRPHAAPVFLFFSHFLILFIAADGAAYDDHEQG